MRALLCRSGQRRMFNLMQDADGKFHFTGAHLKRNRCFHLTAPFSCRAWHTPLCQTASRAGNLAPLSDGLPHGGFRTKSGFAKAGLVFGPVTRVHGGISRTLACVIRQTLFSLCHKTDAPSCIRPGPAPRPAWSSPSECAGVPCEGTARPNDPTVPRRTMPDV